MVCSKKDTNKYYNHINSGRYRVGTGLKINTYSRWWQPHPHNHPYTSSCKLHLALLYLCRDDYVGVVIIILYVYIVDQCHPYILLTSFFCYMYLYDKTDVWLLNTQISLMKLLLLTQLNIAWNLSFCTSQGACNFISKVPPLILSQCMSYEMDWEMGEEYNYWEVGMQRSVSELNNYTHTDLSSKTQLHCHKAPILPVPAPCKSGLSLC